MKRSVNVKAGVKIALEARLCAKEDNDENKEDNDENAR